MTISVLCTSVVDFTVIKNQSEKAQNHIFGANIRLIFKIKFGTENKLWCEKGDTELFTWAWRPDYYPISGFITL